MQDLNQEARSTQPYRITPEEAMRLLVMKPVILVRAGVPVKLRLFYPPPAALRFRLPPAAVTLCLLTRTGGISESAAA